MSDKNYKVSFTVDQTPEEVFAAVTNPRAWWSQSIDGPTDKEGAIFYYHFQDIHRATIKVSELVPGKRVVWHVLQNYFNFVQDNTEWTGTDIVFDIAKKGDQTEFTFTHIGLVPEYECYKVCTDGWGNYIKGSLRDLITTGKGQPNEGGKAITKSEHKLSK